MWPGILLNNIGFVFLICVVVILGPAQLLAIAKGRFYLAIAIFMIELSVLALIYISSIEIGPHVCAWAAHDGVFDCGLPTAGGDAS